VPPEHAGAQRRSITVRESGEETGRLQGLLAEIAALRPGADPQGWASRLWRDRRRRRLSARLARDWPGGFTLHEGGELLYVPRPLDARGRRALFHPPRAHPAALACLRPGAVAADIGAGLGEWALPFARAVLGNGRVLAVEAMPARAAALANTFLANALHQAEPIAGMAGERDGAGQAAPRDGTVPQRSLDSLVAERRLHRLDLVKITVGGQERQVLDGAAATLDRFRPVLVLATGGEAEGDRPAIHYRLRGLGYRPLGILLAGGMAAAEWQAYVAAAPPFRPGEWRRMLLRAEKSPHRT
jgi:precorrin-6B methylase 2